MKIVDVEKTRYVLAFDDAKIPGSGYSFPCDKDGAILWDKVSYPEATRKSLAYCKAHPDRWTSQSRNGRVAEVIDLKRYGICPYCGRKVYIVGSGYMGAFECACGRWYTVLGQEVKPPDEWEDLDEPLDDVPEF